MRDKNPRSFVESDVRIISHKRLSDAELGKLAVSVGAALVQRGFKFTTAESCTGGMVAKLATDIAGSSDWFDRAFITYSNAAKREMLDVDAALLDTVGAVSGEVVVAMASGAIQYSSANIAVAISGIAGPGGATPTKPVGTVWIAWTCRKLTNSTDEPELHDSVCFRFDGDRDTVRCLAAQYALQGILETIEKLS